MRFQKKWASKLALQSKIKRSFLTESLLWKFILKYFSMTFQLEKPILKNICAFICIQSFSFGTHIKTILTKVNELFTMSLLRRFQQVLPRPCLITIFKTFIKPPLDFEDVIFGHAFNNSLHQRLESIQQKSALAITGVIGRTSKEKLYQELTFQSLQFRIWFLKLSLCYKIMKNEFEYSLFSVLQTFQKTNFRICRTNP